MAFGAGCGVDVPSKTLPTLSGNLLFRSVFCCVHLVKSCNCVGVLAISVCNGIKIHGSDKVFLKEEPQSFLSKDYDFRHFEFRFEGYSCCVCAVV
eukprot:1128758-Amphidinium_carterae.1